MEALDLPGHLPLQQVQLLAALGQLPFDQLPAAGRQSQEALQVSAQWFTLFLQVKQVLTLTSQFPHVLKLVQHPHPVVRILLNKLQLPATHPSSLLSPRDRNSPSLAILSYSNTVWLINPYTSSTTPGSLCAWLTTKPHPGQNNSVSGCLPLVLKTVLLLCLSWRPFPGRCW